MEKETEGWGERRTGRVVDSVSIILTVSSLHCVPVSGPRSIK